MNVVEVCVIVILTLVGFWFFGFIGLLVFLLIAIGFTVVSNLHRRYFSEPERQSKTTGNWQCLNCQRVNSPRVKICTKCGFERVIENDN
jgi:uncharacterized paraquat-inducible protein A